MKDRDHAVGYGRPPRHSQFKKGQSGNPRGKTKGRKSLKTELLEELSEKVTVVENGRQRAVSKQTVIIKRMVTDAAQGGAKARADVLKLISQIEALPDQNDADAGPGAAKDAEILVRFRDQLVQQLKEGDK